MAELEKYTEAIYTAPETLHYSDNQRSQSKKTDLVDSNTNDVVYQKSVGSTYIFWLFLITLIKAQGQTPWICLLL